MEIQYPELLKRPLAKSDLEQLELNPAHLTTLLFSLPNITSQKLFLSLHLPCLSAADRDLLADCLKVSADQYLRSNIDACLNTADLLIYLADLSHNDLYRALGLRVRANAYAHGGLGEYQKAIAAYDEAAAIYKNHNLIVLQAGCQYAKLTPLANLGQHEEAFALGEWAAQIFKQHNKPIFLAKLYVNLGAIRRRLGQDSQALALYNKARQIYQQLDQDNDAYLALGRVEQNRAGALRHLGRFDDAITASQTAYRLLQKSGQTVEAARAQQNLAITYFVLGRYNEALTLLDEAKDVFLQDDRPRDAILVELFTSDCLLQLHRYAAVLEKCQQVRQLFTEIGSEYEVAQSYLNEATALAHLRRYDEAIKTLANARTIFAEQGNDRWVAATDLAKALMLLRQGEADACRDTAVTCAAVFTQLNLPLEQAQSLLIAAEAALELEDIADALKFISPVEQFSREHDLPLLAYQAARLRGQAAASQGDFDQARAEYEAAINQLERLRGRLMLEFRSDFLLDKENLYGDLVETCLELNQPEDALAYAERAKSRALLELLAFRVDLGVQARAPEDQPLVAELARLRAERDNLYRRQAAYDAAQQHGTEQKQLQQQAFTLEKQITDLWHQLLIRNADYARDASLWQVRAESVQPHLEEGTVLVEYFTIRDQLVAFLVTRDAVWSRPVCSQISQVQKLLQHIWLNLRSVPRSNPAQISRLTQNIQGVLAKLYACVWQPLAGDLAGVAKIIVVPHGPLHYLPFPALYHQGQYLLERHVLSYLPNASLLSYIQPPQVTDVRLTALCHSYDGRLPHTCNEAQTIADLWQGQVFAEEEATLAHLRQQIAHSDVLHLAVHADFRPDNPLFSGLALADGWLTTLDIFNLKMKAALVTLSACQTGRSVIGGGDELLGLMRAFLSAGAASLVLSLWAAEDLSTARLMEIFYQELHTGKPKSVALRQAQMNILQGDIDLPDRDTAVLYQHPYFWAPFYLVGDAGPLI
ncbi:MAG: CHAT domain-containing protein [Chloroflexi bacterium]|nr:CHAT domain-containing protein [Chloroflexota bacterium]